MTKPLIASLFAATLFVPFDALALPTRPAAECEDRETQPRAAHRADERAPESPRPDERDELERECAGPRWRDVLPALLQTL